MLSLFELMDSVNVTVFFSPRSIRNDTIKKKCQFEMDLLSDFLNARHQISNIMLPSSPIFRIMVARRSESR